MAAKETKLPDPPDPSVWARAEVIVASPSPIAPALVGDGGGLPFAPSVLWREFEPLDPSNPPVIALIEQIDQLRRRAQPKRSFGRSTAPPPMANEEKVAGWRELAATDTEILYGRGVPPQLLTISVTQNRRGKWGPLGASAARPLRAVYEGARASSWRLDPTQPIGPASTELRVLLREQSRASGSFADDRLLPGEAVFGADTVTIRLYVRPLEGYVGPSKLYETPVIVRLSEPIGDRELRDGAIVWSA